MSENHSSICIGCGLCCDGTLHGYSVVKEGDEGAVTACGLEISADGEKKFFVQPCPRSSCGKCSVYACRPKVCRSYRCALLRDLEAGATSEADARDRIATAKKLVAAVRAVDPAAITPSQRSALAKRMTEVVKNGRGSDRDEAARALLAAAALRHFLFRWFWKEEDAGAAIDV